MNSLSLFDKFFFTSSLALLWIILVFWPASLSEKVTPSLTAIFATVMVLAFLYVDEQTEVTEEKKSKQNLGFRGLYYLVVEPIITHGRETLMEAATTKSIQPFIRLARYIEYILRPNSSCSVCRRKVRQCWRPFRGYNIDDGVRKKLRPLDRAFIACERCDPFFPSLEEEEKRRTLYIV